VLRTDVSNRQRTVRDSKQGVKRAPASGTTGVRIPPRPNLFTSGHRARFAHAQPLVKTFMKNTRSLGLRPRSRQTALAPLTGRVAPGSPGGPRCVCSRAEGPFARPARRLAVSLGSRRPPLARTLCSPQPLRTAPFEPSACAHFVRYSLRSHASPSIHQAHHRTVPHRYRPATTAARHPLTRPFHGPGGRSKNLRASPE
jgi:hypothetical protein